MMYSLHMLCCDIKHILLYSHPVKINYIINIYSRMSDEDK